MLIGGPFRRLASGAVLGFSRGDVRGPLAARRRDVVAAAGDRHRDPALGSPVGLPYSDASLFVESVLVPVTEELVFRGVLLSILLGRVRAGLPGPGFAVPLAIAVDGLAFGVAHLANAGRPIDIGFVAPQAAIRDPRSESWPRLARGADPERLPGDAPPRRGQRRGRSDLSARRSGVAMPTIAIRARWT